MSKKIVGITVGTTMNPDKFAVTVDDELSKTSTNPIQNRAVTLKFEEVTTEINNVKTNVGEAELLLSNI